MRVIAILVLGAIALSLIASAGCISKRASVPARVTAEMAR